MAASRSSRYPLAVALMLAFAAIFAAALPAITNPSDADNARSAATNSAMVVTAANAADEPSTRPTDKVARPARGMVFKGLAASTRCRGGYLVEATGQCTHGPDRARGAATSGGC